MTKKAVKTTTKTTKKAAAPVVIAPVASPEPVVTAPVAEALSKRITPGAEVKEYRIVVSQRRGQSGWFLQGGHFSGVAANGRNSFVCGVELFFADRKEAAAALAERRAQPAA
jgi:hypothetical protein